MKRLILVMVVVMALIARPARAFSGPPDYGQIDSYVQAQMKAASIPGLAYGIVQDGAVVHLAAFGQARADGAPMTLQTPLRIGSVTKTMTGLAIRQLVVAGKVNVNDPVQRYLPWFTLADPQAAAQITVAQLLSHTSGISKADGIALANILPGPTAEEIARRMAKIRPDRPVGEGYEYSNLNYVLLGLVIEAANGQSYSQYVQEHIFTPLGMAHSYTDEDTARADGMAEGYRIFYGLPVRGPDPFADGMLSAGGVISSAEDLAKYAAALSNQGMYAGNSVVTPDGRPEAQPQEYTYYWQPEENVTLDDRWTHGGSTLSYESCITFSPARRLGVVVLTNVNTAQVLPNTISASTIAQNAYFLVLGQTPGAAGLPVGVLYIGIDLFLLLAAVSVAREVHRLPRWRYDLIRAEDRRKFTRSALGNLAMAVFLLVILPVLTEYLVGGMLIGSPLRCWGILFFSLPDIFIPLFVFGLVLLMVGGVKLLSVLGKGSFQERQEPVQLH